MCSTSLCAPRHARSALRAVALASALSLLALAGLSQLAAAAPTDCPPSDHPCSEAGEPGCLDVACCKLVCGFDAFCCNVIWDGLCVDAAGVLCTTADPCTTADHDCLTEGGPGCTDTACCETVCAANAFCCGTAWDGNCVIDATMLCGYFPPANDPCDQAMTITDGITPFSTLGATTDGPPLPPSCERVGDLSFVNDIWFLYTATCDGTVTISTCNSADYDTRLALYSTNCNDLRLYCCNDDAAGCGLTSTLTCDVQCGKSYLLRVGGYAGSGSGTLDVSCSGTPCNPCCEDPICTIRLRSGQIGVGVPGSPGQLDFSVRYWTGPGEPTGCTLASLADRNGDLPFACEYPAKIVFPHQGWKSSLDCDPAARWINSTINASFMQGSPGQSVVYCHPFEVCSEPFNTACITFCWLVDDRLGDPPGGPAPIGLYIENGGTFTSIPAVFGGHHIFESTVTAQIPPGAIKPGLNHLFVYQRNLTCLASGVIYSARIDLCQDCIAPPPSMQGWWTLDEYGGTIADDQTANKNDGTHQGGPTPTPGVVNNGLQFDGVNDVVVVPPDSTLDVSCEAFSVDLWVKHPGGTPADGFQTLVSHYDSQGWIFSVNAQTGILQLFLESQTTRCTVSSTGVIPLGAWAHVAVTVSACCDATPRIVTFYINGVPSGSTSIDPLCCDLASTSGAASLELGGMVPISDWLKGTIDEVEYFCRVLTAGEIAALHAAGPFGKCKASCWASSNRQVCGSAPASAGSATITNASSQPVTYSYTIVEDPSCSVTGMSYAPTFGTITVGPNSTGTIMFGANTSGASGYGKACFKVRFVSGSTGEVCTALGSVIYKACAGEKGPLRGTGGTNVVLTPDGEGFGGFQFTAGSNGAMLDFQIVAVPQDAALVDFPLSLNGLPPGEPIVGSFDAGPDGDIDFLFPILWNWCGTLSSWFDVQFLVAPAGSGGPYEAVASLTVTMGPPTANECPADVDGDGEVGGADLGILLGSFGGPGAGDLDGNGMVDGGDIGLLLGAWGPCL